MILTNPLGLLALLGIPAVLLIHFLQRQARVIPVSTLFLLEQTQRESTSGRRFDRLTNSVPLWLQLLMVFLLTWLLVEPRYPKPTSTQQIAIVVDSSASMSVFKEKLISTLDSEIPKLQGPATQVQLYLLESDPNAPLLYSGTNIDDALAAVDKWSPTAGALDPGPALRLARSRIRREGLLIYVTDSFSEETQLPFDAQLLAVGSPTANLGFTGVAFSEDLNNWQATVRNYSDTETTSQWQVAFPDDSLSEMRPLVIAPNGLTTLTGTFPEGANSLTVQLAGDAFTLDDRLPLVRPKPKQLLTESALPPKFGDFEKRFLSFFPNLSSTGSAASLPDLTLAAYDPLLPILPETHSIITINESARSRRFLAGGIVAEPHPLTQGLNWQSLQSRETIAFPVTASDTVLLWQGQRPLIVLRESRGAASEEQPSTTKPTSHLIFNFDLSLSNALRLPSTVILLHRFTSSIRDNKVAYEAINTETNQEIKIAKAPQKQLTVTTTDPKTREVVTRTMKENEPLRAPALPAIFTIKQGEETLLESASYFADTREADLREANSTNQLNALMATSIQQNTSEDYLWPLWTLLVLAALLSAWHFTRSRNPETEIEEKTAAIPAS